MTYRVLVLIVVALILIGCSGHSGGSSAAKASQLVTATDAQQILGGNVRLGDESQAASEGSANVHESRCEYVGDGGATLNVVVDTSPSEDEARKAFNTVRKGLASFQKIEDANGIGDEAFLAQGPSSRRLTVRKGIVVLLLDARRSNGEDLSVDALKKTATHIVSQL